MGYVGRLSLQLAVNVSLLSQTTQHYVEAKFFCPHALAAHLYLGEDAIVLLNSVTCTVSVTLKDNQKAKSGQMTPC